MYDGTINCNDIQIAPQDTDTNGVANLYGGIIDTNEIEIATEGGTGLLDLQGGTLLINADAREVVTEYINSGKIVGYGGANAVSVTYDEGAGVTTVVATVAALASNPSPANGETDVLRDVVLSWTPGASDVQHDVYFAASFDDVNAAANLDPMGPDKVYRGRQDISSYVIPESLDFGQTYYWRIDEADVSTSRLDRGDIWAFTAEPFSYPIENITAAASSSEAAKGPDNTVNGSGLDDSGLLHGKDGDDNMWLSSSEPDGAWIEYEFDKLYKLHQMFVWNYNGSGLNIAYGLKNVTIEHSTDGVNYTTLGTTHEFLIAPGADDYAHNTIVDFGGAMAKYVKITATTNWSNGITDQYGLSEVRFLHMSMHARKPSPESGATDVNLNPVLSFRAGRQAAEHNVYFSSDFQTVTDETISPVRVPVGGSSTSYDTGSLDLNQTYYWKVNEVNETESPATWPGNVWNFTTQEYLVVDDFESYNDINEGEPGSNRIYIAWVDGYDNPATNGSTVGHLDPPFYEQTIIHSGNKSMPFVFDNSVGKSEATLTLTNQRDWTVNGVNTLIIWLRGDAANAAEPLYVVLNGNAVINHDNPNAAQESSWTQWNIDLTRFADQGVNLADINTITIGLGNRNNPMAGGTGMMFFDDIRLSIPAP